jgi:uncharacterized LabA/DUF88 family protein
MCSSSMMKVGVFVDVSNVYSNGGQRMRFDVLRQYAEARGMVLRLNAYLSYDADRATRDKEYADKALGYQEAIRDMGWQTTVKEVKWYNDTDSGKRVGKANADLEMAVDVILQSRNLDLVVLVTGDGDFVKVSQALRNLGNRVEVLGFDNVSQNLRKEVDLFTSGYIIPELIPTNRRKFGTEEGVIWGQAGSIVRGYSYWHTDEGYGYFAYLDKITENSWLTDPRHPDSPYKAAFFHDTNLPPEFNPNNLPSRRYIFEFELGEGEKGMYAINIRMASRL